MSYQNTVEKIEEIEDSIEQFGASLPYNVEAVSEIVDGRQTFVIVCDDGYDVDVLAMLKKMNKKLKKWGSETRLVSTGERFVEVQPWYARKKVLRRKVLLTIDAPAVAGTKAKLIGSFERAEADGEVYCHALNDTPEEVIQAFKHRWNECDHCKTRRDRNQSFVCQTEVGEIVVIGRQCSQAYLGLHPAEILAREGIRKLLTGLAGFTPDGEWVGFCTRYRDMEDLVLKCYMVAKRFKGYSRELRMEMLDHIAALDGGRFKGAKEIRDWYVEHPLDEPLDYYALANYVESMRGDYGRNLQIALLSERVRPKRVTLILSGIGLFVGRAAKLKMEAEPNVPKKERKLLAGDLGQRLDFVGTVVKTVPYEGFYGNGVAITIEGDDGSNSVHFSMKDENPVAGNRYAIRATIKRQDADKVQTVLTRAEYKPVAA